MITGVYLDATQLNTTKRHCLSVRNCSFPEIKNGSAQKGSFFGRVITPPLFISFTIVMEWMLIGSSFSDLVSERDNFIKLIGAITRTGSAVFKVVRADGSTLQIEVKSGKVSGELKAGSGTSSSLLVELEAEYPFFQSDTATTNTAYIFQGGGMAIPFGIPMNMGTGGSNELTISNDGNYEAFPIFTFYGPLNFPTLYNLTTDKIINLNLSLASGGDSVVIDTYKRTVLVNPGQTNGRQYVTGDFWTLSPGANVIHLGNGTYNSTGRCEISFRDHYLNI